ncbi:hypothetical protein M422DRAFT_275939 [Sphaerobolus stellatus SS14]|uniref:Uncharacterized protein n=1 Tax=Sphaerobolus stellatus (strain SS14) TaxID=990650 RepID=A0A0C9T3L1_SPHS4|nr:hypothetical protein M422DRAFT_275939 [Sphaerobolus stellatus SS14]
MTSTSNFERYILPTREVIQDRVNDAFGCVPCKFQIEAAMAFLRGKDVTLIAPGKTLAYWIALLFNNNDMVVIVTSLNVLGEQTQVQLEEAGVKSIMLNKENVTKKTYKVHFYLEN